MAWNVIRQYHGYYLPHSPSCYARASKMESTKMGFILWVFFPFILRIGKDWGIEWNWQIVDLTSLGGTAAGITWTFVDESSRQDPEKRAYVSAMVSSLSSLLSFLLPLFPISLPTYSLTHEPAHLISIRWTLSHTSSQPGSQSSPSRLINNHTS